MQNLTTPFVFSLVALSVNAAAQSNETPLQGVHDELEHIEVKRHFQPYRGNVPLIDTPQAVDRITADTLANEGITRFIDALDFAPTVVRQNNSGGMFDSFAIRGFSGDENNPSGYLINGFNVRGYSGNRSTVNVQTIEVMKGPGSALYGQGEPGGTINIITKKPQFEEQGYIQGTVGNFDKKQVEFDYTNGINSDMAYRVNGSYEDSDTYRDNVFFKNLNLNPSFIWNISDHTSLSYQMEILDQEKPLDRGVFILNNDFDAVEAEDFYGDIRDGAHEVKAFGHQLVLNHELSHNWHLLSGFAYRDSSFEGQSSDTELSEGRQLLYTDPSILSRQRRTRDYQAQDLSLRFELSGVVDVAGLVNNVLFGLDYYNYHIDTDYRRWRTAWGAGDTTYSINPENPDYTIFRPDVTPTTLTAEKQKGLGFYVQDVVELSEATKLLVGFRVDKFEQDILNKLSNEGQEQDQTEVTPRFGFVYEINDSVSIYTSYAEGFRPNPGLDSDRNAFDPEETTSFEVGAKWENIADMFSGSVAIFDAEKTNMLTAEPNTGFSATLGEVESQGVEFQLTTDITSDIRLDMAYAYIDAKTANEVNNLDWGVPIPKGSRLINIAKHSGYISLNHFTSVFEKEAFFGVTMRYVGDRLGQTTDPTFILPSYTLVNLAGSVNISDALSMRFDVNNLFDRDNFENSYHQLWTMPGSPTNYTVSVKYQF
ncbi:TonB-dependent receptor [Alteromonas macleodii str. 'Black Sea 11']|nr:TonB-dependent receptor [Alteromonas macleodii str. 'Black Sea 11']NKW89425.1 TonB-dependent siderophore receptor [Alteromonadaceae bacterium A_SAG4]NKX18842.1 TonB-dependent siderophore receptor [Alteromonadaceae bacterium A_SAG5]NKX19697.1 TonB-dependent siderophore receptor [Alteromonadaceae bacterium A_SAG8]NKX35680.1 TonB-dependent siderophore receptor [Alteromonadaceae bacterium A_SAG3]NKX69622.1 TonB-dependent siderophore receptor [Alteromonadaceae bacterium A_SAG7]